jgi:hypothetical protein
MIINGEGVIIWKDVVVSEFKATSRRLHEDTEPVPLAARSEA